VLPLGGGPSVRFHLNPMRLPCAQVDFAWQCKGGGPRPGKSHENLRSDCRMSTNKGVRGRWGDSGTDLHQFQYLRLDLIGQIIPRRDHLIEFRIL